jgi:hypothetical protein
VHPGFAQYIKQEHEHTKLQATEERAMKQRIPTNKQQSFINSEKNKSAKT